MLIPFSSDFNLFNFVKFVFTVPVCFSIKKPKEVDKLELCSALPVEESSDEEEEKEEDCTIKSHTESVDKLSHGKKSKAHTISMDKWGKNSTKFTTINCAKTSDRLSFTQDTHKHISFYLLILLLDKRIA